MDEGPTAQQVHAIHPLFLSALAGGQETPQPWSDRQKAEGQPAQETGPKTKGWQEAEPGKMPNALVPILTLSPDAPPSSIPENHPPTEPWPGLWHYPAHSHPSLHLSPLATQDGKLFHPHFTDEEMEAQEMSEFLPSYPAGKLPNGGRSPNLETSVSSLLLTLNCSSLFLVSCPPTLLPQKNSQPDQKKKKIKLN